MYSNIKVYQNYLVTTIKVGYTTRSLYASSGQEAEGVPTNNQRGWGSSANQETGSSKRLLMLNAVQAKS